jgi:hypothetical protein
LDSDLEEDNPNSNSTSNSNSNPNPNSNPNGKKPNPIKKEKPVRAVKKRKLSDKLQGLVSGLEDNNHSGSSSSMASYRNGSGDEAEGGFSYKERDDGKEEPSEGMHSSSSFAG